MLREGLVIDKAVPVIYYNCNDRLSMDDNKSYSFCYHNRCNHCAVALILMLKVFFQELLVQLVAVPILFP